MRLLKREKSGWFPNTYTFNLTQFNSQDAPSEYAILSHRWGPDEVTYKDIENGTAKTKAGYKKLEFCGEQAARDGLLYFWIDTCCIDKTNSVELSEAINSMFKWYQNARKCYVYLPDVSTSHDVSAASAESNWEPQFRKSEWFTRGWTLQELIAPTTVEFFSIEGEKLGDKTSLKQQIYHITGISVEVLEGRSLSEVDEKERFSWTARRQTMIEEDAVYCLLGIFDIHMSLIYGEGQEKALARLRRKIERSSRPNMTTTADAPWIVPFQRNPRFTAREPQLKELESRIFTKDHTSRMAITGLGGVGKTQLVLELLCRIKEKHKDCLIIWIPAINTESLEQGYLMVAQQLGITGCDDKEANIMEVVQDYLNQRNSGPWLLVFDNADDIDLWMTTPAVVHKNMNETGQSSRSVPRRLIDYLPRNRQGCTIFTTRNRKAAVSFAQQNIITVLEMDKEAAAQLLRRSLISPDLVDDVQKASALLTALTYLPLAIAQAAAYINANEITLTDYVSLLEDKEEDAIDILSEDFEDLGRYQNVKNPVATTWLISFEQIRRSDPVAAEYLSFIACIHPRDIPESLLPPGPSRKRALDAIGTLTAYSFISRRPNESSFDIHRLVYLAMRNWLRKEGLLSHWTGNTIARLYEVFPDNDHKNRTTWRKYLPHATQLLASRLVDTNEQRRINLMWRCGACLCSDGRWSEAEVMFTEILAIERETPGDKHPSVLSFMLWLALVYKNQSRWKETEQLELYVVKIRRMHLGIDNAATLNSMHHLASTYMYQHRWDEAEQLQVQLVESYEAKLGPDHPRTSENIGNLATVYSGQGRLEDAEQLSISLMNSTTLKYGVHHPHTIVCMNNLAHIWKGLDRNVQAIQLMRECLEGRNHVLGVEHPNTLSSAEFLAAWEAECSVISTETVTGEEMS